MFSDGVKEATCGVEPAAVWSSRTIAGIVAIHGEVDISSCDAFAAIVQAVIRRARDDGTQHEVHLDLGGLDFINIGGARILAAASAMLGPDGQLVIHRPSPLLRRILGIAWGPLTGIAFAAAELDGSRVQWSEDIEGAGPTGGPSSVSVLA